MSALGTHLYTWIWGQKVGEDGFGNRYYQKRRGKKYKASLRKQRRWVLYKGETEASRVPPEWHAWLHYTVDKVPEDMGLIYDWQLGHKANMTGTDKAYRPSGHVLTGGERAKTGGDYQVWTPE